MSFSFNESALENHHLENDAFSDKSERDNIEESENEMHENSRKTNESESDQSELHGESSQEKKGTTYLEQNYEEFGEVTILTSIYLPTQFVIHLSTAFFTL